MKSLTPSRHAFSLPDLLAMIIATTVLLSMTHVLISDDAPLGNGANAQKHRLKSQSNLRTLGLVAASYAADWNDNQFSILPHNLSAYGDCFDSAQKAFNASQEGARTIGVQLGWTGEKFVSLRIDTEEQRKWLMPITFEESPVGSFRMLNLPGFNRYLAGRFYDENLYAPADHIVLDALGERLNEPNIGPFDAPEGGSILWSSYAFSPAAIYSPQVLSSEFTDPWTIPSGFRTPAVSQCRYPDLKTHIIEHHWLYNRPANDVIEGFESSRYAKGEPLYFNHGTASSPNALFYDGSTRELSMQRIMQDDARAREDGQGLWHRAPGGATNGYYERHGRNDFRASPHIFTRDGIFGRDTLSRGPLLQQE